MTDRLRAFPVGFVTSGRTLLIVGGCARRACRVRHATGFDWTSIRVVVPPGCHAPCARCRKDPRVRVARREVRERDLSGAALVLHTSLRAERAARLASWCRRKGLALGTMDKPEFSDIYYCALLRRGPLIVAIATAGESPALSAALRKWLNRHVGRGWAHAGNLMAETRRALPPGRRRRALLRRVGTDPGFVSAIERDDVKGMQRTIRDALDRMRR